MQVSAHPLTSYALFCCPKTNGDCEMKRLLFILIAVCVLATPAAAQHQNANNRTGAEVDTAVENALDAGSASGILKSDGANSISAATAGTDYLTELSQDTTPQLGGTLNLNDQVLADNADTLTDQDGTPDVTGSQFFITGNTGATSYTDFVDSDGDHSEFAALETVAARTICIVVNDALTTFDFTSSNLAGMGADYAAASGESFMFVFNETTDKWHLLGSASEVEDVAFADTWNGDLDAASKNVIYDYLHSMASGDDGAVTNIAANAVVEGDLKAVDSASDEDVFTYESTTGDFEWHSVAEIIAQMAEGGLPNDSIVEADLKAVDSSSDEDILTKEDTTGDFEWHSIAELVATLAEGNLPDSMVVSDDIKDNTITTSDLAAALTFAEGDLIDLSAITMSAGVDEGIALPVYADVAPATEKYYAAYDAANNAIMVRESGGWVNASAGSGAATTLNFVVTSAEGSLTGESVLTAGYAIDVTDAGGDGGAVTVAVDTTEISADGSDTWSDNSQAAIVWTFDVSGTDHTVTWGNGLATFGDAVTVTDTLTASNGIVLGASKSITGATAMTIGGGSETVAINGTNFVVSAAGAMTTVGAITSSGVVTATGFTIGDAAITETELEIIDGATLSTSDINIIDGISDSGDLTAAELLYVDGVTSAIQTQLDARCLESVFGTALEADDLELNSTTLQLAAEIPHTDVNETISGAWTFSGNVTLDDGTGASPSFILKDATDETWTISKADGGNLDIDINNASNRTVDIANAGAGNANLAVDGTISEAGALLSATYQGLNAYLTDIAGMSATIGDIMYFDGTDWVILDNGTNGYFLQAQGAAAPAWAEGSSTGVNETYGSGWDGDTAAPEKDDVYDAIEDLRDGTLSFSAISVDASATPSWTGQDSDTDAVGTFDIKADAATATYDSLMRFYVDDSTGEDTLYMTIHGTNEEVLFAKKIDLTSAGIENVGNISDDAAFSITSSSSTVTVESVVFTGGALSSVTNIGMSGDLATTGTRVTKGWFTDLEVTNLPTVNGSTISPTNITPVDTGDEDATFYPILVDGATGTQATETDGELTYNPNSSTLTATNFVGALTGSASGNDTLASADFANQGTTTTVLHGNAAGNPSWAAISEADLSLSDNSTANVSTSAHGFIVKLPDDATKIFDGAGSWTDIEDLADEIAAGIAEGELASGVVVSDDIKDGTIATGDLADATVGPTVKVTDLSGGYTLGTTSSKEAYNGIVYCTGAGTLTLPAVAAGMSFTVITIGANQVVVQPDEGGTADTITLDGTDTSAGDTITNTSTTGDMMVCSYYKADFWYCASGSNDGDPWTDTD